MKNKRKGGTLKRGVGRPAKYTSPVQMQKIIDSYFEECDKKERPYTVTGLAVALGLDRKALIEYVEKPEFSNTIKKAKAKVEEFLERRLLSNGCVTGVIFNLKNNFGWVDRQEIDMPQGIDIIIKSATENKKNSNDETQAGK